MSWWQRLIRGRTREPAPAADEPDPALPAEPVEVARDPAQEAAIAGVLDGGDAAAELAVYGDWLAARGDPRGELVATQSRLEHARGDWNRDYHPRTIEPFRAPSGPLAREAAALIARHRTHFLGAPVHGRRERQPIDPVEWDAGFWRRLRFHPPDDLPQRKADLAALLAHPSAVFLRGLWIGTTWGEPIAAFVPDRLPETLRELYLGDFAFPDDSELSWTSVGDITPIYTRAPRLERLVLQGLAPAVGARLELPELRTLETIATDLTEDTLQAIAASRLDRLEQLVLWTGVNLDVQPVIELVGGAFPSLRHLGIRNCADSDAIVDALVRSPLLPQLRTLDLSLGTLSPAGARTLEQARDRLAHLASIDLSENALAEGDVERLRALAPNVALADQREGEDGRYAPISE